MKTRKNHFRKGWKRCLIQPHRKPFTSITFEKSQPGLVPLGAQVIPAQPLLLLHRTLLGKDDPTLLNHPPRPITIIVPITKKLPFMLSNRPPMSISQTPYLHSTLRSKKSPTPCEPTVPTVMPPLLSPNADTIVACVETSSATRAALTGSIFPSTAPNSKKPFASAISVKMTWIAEISFLFDAT